MQSATLFRYDRFLRRLLNALADLTTKQVKPHLTERQRYVSGRGLYFIQLVHKPPYGAVKKKLKGAAYGGKM